MPQRTCSIPGCDKPHRARGLCAQHWNATYRKDQHREVACVVCGKPVVKHAPGIKRRPTCSFACREELRKLVRPPRLPREPARDREEVARNQRAPIRAAYEDGHTEALLAAVRADCEITDTGCWMWQRILKDGYPVVIINGKQHFVHRLTVEASMGLSLGSQPAHHLCANTACVNPDHIQPVTHYDNAAEMLARRYMERRIIELESALRDLRPNHPLLGHISITATRGAGATRS